MTHLFQPVRNTALAEAIDELQERHAQVRQALLDIVVTQLGAFNELDGSRVGRASGSSMPSCGRGTRRVIAHGPVRPPGDQLRNRRERPPAG